MSQRLSKQQQTMTLFVTTDLHGNKTALLWYEVKVLCYYSEMCSYSNRTTVCYSTCCSERMEMN